jgi:hypothetical protein
MVCGSFETPKKDEVHANEIAEVAARPTPMEAMNEIKLKNDFVFSSFNEGNRGSIGTEDMMADSKVIYYSLPHLAACESHS